ncbi:MAG: glycosyltransferase family 2 protein [Rhodoglobus sp.]
MPRLSVLMPARNSSATIRLAVVSTLRAMPPDSELLVLDDASTDDTAAIAASTGDPRVTVIPGGTQRGVALAGQYLLSRASGEFVARMDSDDVCLPGRFRAQLAAIDQGADVVFSTYQMIGGGLRKPVPPITFGPDAAAAALLVDCPYPHSTMLARSDALRDAGGYQPSAIAEDYDLWLRAAANGSVMRRLARPTVLIRVSATQVSGAAGWRESLATDPTLQRSYQALVQRLWGTDSMPWFPELAFTRSGPLTAHGRELLDPFVHRFTASLDALAPLERWSLSRRARQELGKRAA